MTQKELSYFEDAIGHETNIIKIIEESIKNLENEELVTYLNEEKERHTSIKNNLLNKLEGEANA